MPDRITQINDKLDNILSEYCYQNQEPCTLEKSLEGIKKLLDGCSDNSQVVIAYDRQQLNDYIWSNTKKTYNCTDEEWEEAWNHIHNDDTAWSYMSDTCYEAEGNLFHKLEDEGRLPS